MFYKIQENIVAQEKCTEQFPLDAEEQTYKINIHSLQKSIGLKLAEK